MLGMLLQRFDLVDHLRLPAQDQDHAHGQARRLPHPGPAACRTCTLDRGGAERPGQRQPAPSPPRPPRRPRWCARHGTPLPVLFGSNLGTAESIATRLAQEGTERGFDVTLGRARRPRRRPAPAAARWSSSPRPTTARLPTTPPRSAAGSAGAAAGRGRRGGLHACSAAATRSGPRRTRPCPTLIDDAARRTRRTPGPPPRRGQRRGGLRRRLPRLARRPLVRPRRGARPAGRGRRGRGPAGPRLSITLTNRQVTNPVIVSYEARPARVRDNRELIARGERRRPPSAPTRHIEIALPAGTSYQAGDHLGVLPRNGIDPIRRVMARFGLDAGQYVTIIPNSGAHTHLPIDEPAPLLGVLGSCVELQDVADPGRHRRPRPPHRRPRAEGGAGGAGRRRRGAHAALPRARSTRPTARCWTCSTSSRAARCPSRSTSTCCPRCGRATTPSPPRRWSSPDACSITVGRPAGARARSGTGTFTGVCSAYLAHAPVERHRLRVRPEAVDRRSSPRRTRTSR